MKLSLWSTITLYRWVPGIKAKAWLFYYMHIKRMKPFNALLLTIFTVNKDLR